MVGAYKYCYIAKRCDEMFKARTLMLIENKLERKVPYELRFMHTFQKKSALIIKT
mgnify:CR=1 FL=1